MRASAVNEGCLPPGSVRSAIQGREQHPIGCRKRIRYKGKKRKKDGWALELISTVLETGPLIIQWSG